MSIEHRYSYLREKHAKSCAIVRYGGLGDAIQTSSILPWLKSQGYHITFYTVPASWDVVKNDPHIDEVVIQDVDAIPNEQLGAFWDYTKKKYDRFINLSESVERTLLAYPGTTQYNWSHSMRDKYLNINYLEFIHDIAGVPFPPMSKFYPTDAETEWAKAQKKAMRGPVILWVLGGSGVHKTWGGLDAAIDTIMRKNDGTNFVLTGDKNCAKLEAGLENVPRIHCTSGKWSVRQSMAFAQVADVVIGPETGVLNAVAFDAVRKIIMLSHSSVNNLTRDWVNCISLTAASTACYPCHKIHFNWNACNQDGETGIAKCQADIPVSAVVNAIAMSLNQQQREAA